MEFIAPIPFTDAIQKLGDQSIVGSTFSSSEWSDLPVELRENAFFSSRVESARFLDRAQGALGDFLAGTKTTAENGEPVLATGSRAAFVSQMQDFLAGEGVLRTTGGLTDIASEKRLGLIFDVKTRQAQDFGNWKQGMDPDVLNEFPAQRFIRVRDVKTERESHIQYDDQVFLKTDPIWALVINKDFGVPWGPWGWGCGHDVEDVDRKDAEKLGLIRPGQRLTPEKKFFNTNLQASVKTMAPDLVEKLKKEFGDRVVVEGDSIRWRTSEADTAAPAPVVTATAATRTSPVSSAIMAKVTGGLRDQVSAALAAIDKVHDDGTLPDVPLVSTRQSALGYLTHTPFIGSQTALQIGVRANGSWPALTAVHEIGHLLDLEGIGVKGGFATLNSHAEMATVLDAAAQTDAIKGLQAKLANAGGLEQIRMYRYYLKPQEIWARAYAQYIAQESGSPVLQQQLQSALDEVKFRQWDPADFKIVADAITAMFKKAGWL